MKNVIKFISWVISSSYLAGCSGQPMSTMRNSEYVKDKLEFDTNLTKHFPNVIETNRFLTVSKASPETNKVSFILYEFGVGVKALDSLNQLIKSNHLISYNWNDTCLLIIHPNETLDPFDDESVDPINKRGCLDNKHPIPNFINLKSPNSKYGISMDSTFNIFVLESKSGKYSQQITTPLKSMPNEWKNGFSRGYAISLAKAVVIYWIVIW